MRDYTKYGEGYKLVFLDTGEVLACKSQNALKRVLKNYQLNNIKNGYKPVKYMFTNPKNKLWYFNKDSFYHNL